MMKSKKYVRVAVLFLATVIIAFWGLNYLKGKNLLSTERSYYSVYNRIGGLTRSSPVTINGFQIGQVRNIDLSEKQPGKIEVRFSVSYRAIKIPRGSSARIYSTDLMGTKGIALDLADNPDLCEPNDTLAGTIEGDLRDQVNAQMLPLKIKIETLMSSMDSVLTAIQLVFDESNRNNLAESFLSVNQTLNNLESASRFLNDYVISESGRVTSLLGSVDTLSQDLLKRTGEIKNFISNMNRFSDTLAILPLNATVASLHQVLTQLNLLAAKITGGEGTLGKLIIDDSLYNALISTNSSLNRLVEDVRINPGKYLRISLTNKTQPVYAGDDSELARILAGEGTSDYYLCLLRTSSSLAPGHPDIESLPSGDFIQVGGLYYYYAYKNSRIEPCLKKLERMREKFPDAGIYTWVNGQWKRLDI